MDFILWYIWFQLKKHKFLKVAMDFHAAFGVKTAQAVPSLICNLSNCSSEVK